MDKSNLSIIETFSPVTQKFIDYLSDLNLSTRDVDVLMGFSVGETARKVKTYPLLKEIVKDARTLAIRRAGLEKEGAFRAYGEALSAKKMVPVGDKAYDEMEDHEVRLKAADRVLTVLGESPTKISVEHSIDPRKHEILRKYVD